MGKPRKTKFIQCEKLQDFEVGGVP